MKIRRELILLASILIMTVLSFSACALSSSGSGEGRAASAQAGNPAPVDTGFILPGPGSYDSADTAVLVKKNKDDNTVTLLNPDLGKQYTLKVEGVSTLYDKYGEAIALEQLEPGEIVDVTFLKSQKRLNSMQISSSAWVYDQVERYGIDTARHDITIGDSTFKISDKTLYLSGGRRIEPMDLNEADVLTVKGIGTTALSISVDRGHGYLRLNNDENFIGGWIEIGQSRICRITEDMLLTVPEGSYQVLISHNGGGGVKDVVINRNEEITLDIGDLAVAEKKTGTVLFSLSPSKTTLYIDGEQADTSGPVTLDYGIHQVIAKADGYKSITSYIKVGQASAGVDITLDRMNSAEDEEDEEEKEKEDTTQETSSYYKVYVDAPEGAEVYLDGNYVGISPCNFRKSPGAHIITLRRTGFETRSYTVQIDEEEKDISYSFADLAPGGGQTAD